MDRLTFSAAWILQQKKKKKKEAKIVDTRYSHLAAHALDMRPPTLQLREKKRQKAHLLKKRKKSRLN